MWVCINLFSIPNSKRHLKKNVCIHVRFAIFPSRLIFARVRALGQHRGFHLVEDLGEKRRIQKGDSLLLRPTKFEIGQTQAESISKFESTSFCSIVISLCRSFPERYLLDLALHVLVYQGRSGAISEIV